MKRNDLTSQKFGKLTVIGFFGLNKTRNAKWVCICECGESAVVLGYQLKNGCTKSCKCLWNENRKKGWDAVRLEKGQAARNQVLLGYKRKAQKAGRVWELTDEQFNELVTSDCYYCGSVPSNKHRAGKNSGGFVYNGIDRMNSELGYVAGNVRPCCWVCNWMKRNLTEEAFFARVEKIYKRHNKASGASV